MAQNGFCAWLDCRVTAEASYPSVPLPPLVSFPTTVPRRGETPLQFGRSAGDELVHINRGCSTVLVSTITKSSSLCRCGVQRLIANFYYVARCAGTVGCGSFDAIVYFRVPVCVVRYDSLCKMRKRKTLELLTLDSALHSPVAADEVAARVVQL